MNKILLGMIFLLVFCIYTYLHYFPAIPKRKKMYPYAILLGCPCHEDGSLCSSAKKRCAVAIEQYKKKQYQTLVITGGAVKNTYIEAEAMKAYIRKQADIPILVETKAKNTWENFLFTKALINDCPVLIITSGTHARRACAIAKHFFHTYSAAWYPEHRLKHIVRETISRMIYIRFEIRKHIKNR